LPLFEYTSVTGHVMEQRPEGQASDKSLMLAVSAGDLSKLGILFERHHGRLFNFLVRLTGNRHLSEDLVQEAFVRLLKYRHTYRAESQFTTWMFQIARNARVDHFRKNQAGDVSLDGEEREYVSELPLPDEHAEQNEEMRMLMDALSHLPEKKREVLLLRSEGMKFEEIARVLDCPVNTVKGRAFEAIRDLRTAVQTSTGRRAS